MKLKYIFPLAMFFFSFINGELSDSSKNIDLYANLFYWTARESGASTWAEVIKTDGEHSTNDILEVCFDWDPGFKVGVGYQYQHFDIQASYAQFNTKGKDSISSIPGSVHSTFLGNFYADNPFGIGLSGPSYESANIIWKIKYNIVDFCIGCNFCKSKDIVLCPFLGIKGGWIDQSIDTNWINPDIFGFTFTSFATENLENNYWGVGPEIGLKTKWILYSCNRQIYLFGDFSTAIMWGHWSFSDEFRSNFSEQMSVELQDINGGSTMFRTFIGSGWDQNFCNDQYRFSIKLGYETQFWLDQLQFYSFTKGRLANELTLQGGTLEFCIDF